MSDLSYLERQKFERLLGMSGGYVLGFTNQTFDEFVADSVGKNIYAQAYAYSSGSKANRLRGFWKAEPNHVVAKLMTDLLAYVRDLGISPEEATLCDECDRIVSRLRAGAPIEAFHEVSADLTEDGFERIVKSVRDSIEKNEPDTGLDRLHTFVVKYVRALSDRRGIVCDKNKPLHSLFGEYLKDLEAKGQIQSEMSRRILRSTISILEAFNQVRNDQSLAHDNPILNYDESLLIFSHVVATLRYIQAVEAAFCVASEQTHNLVKDDDDLPF